MSLRVYYEVLNQKGSPALYTDTFANRPAFGFMGRLFISTDTGQIFEDTGSAWTLVADAGVGGGTLSSVTANGNTTAFGIVVTAGGVTANSLIKSGGTSSQFLKADGSVDSKSYVPYTGATADVNLGTFDLTADLSIVNQVKAVGSGGLSINSNSGTQIALLGVGGGDNFTINGILVLGANSQLRFTQDASIVIPSSGFSAIEGVNQDFNFVAATTGGNYKYFSFVTSGLTNNTLRSYTLPDATGTLALTSNLGSYLPLSGGTLTGNLSINRGSGTGLQVASDNVVITAATGFASPRQLIFTCGNGPTTTLEAKGLGGNYITDFNIKTYNSSGTAFDVFFGDSAGNVGIGTTTPTNIGGFTGLTINNTSNGSFIDLNNSGTNNLRLLTLSSADQRIQAQGSLRIDTGGSARVNITNTGNVGIGTTSPSTIFQVKQTSGEPTISSNYNNTHYANLFAGNGYSGVGSFSNTPFILYSNSNERLRILPDTYGKILFGNGLTSDFAAGHLCVQADLTVENAWAMKNTNASTGNYIIFVNQSNGTTGSITQNTSTSVLFIATSDYRCKENITPIENAMDKILKIKPVTYNWKNTDNEIGEGFIAHELQEIVPLAVSGIKDELNLDGSIKPQGVDYGKLTPLLVKAIQEQQLQIEELKLKINALQF